MQHEYQPRAQAFRSGFCLADFSPKLRDKIRNRKPGFEATQVPSLALTLTSRLPSLTMLHRTSQSWPAEDHSDAANFTHVDCTCVYLMYLVSVNFVQSRHCRSTVPIHLCPNTNWKPTCSSTCRLPPGERTSGYCTVWTNGPWVECKHLHKYIDKNILYSLYLGCDCYYTLLCTAHKGHTNLFLCCSGQIIFQRGSVDRLKYYSHMITMFHWTNTAQQKN